MQTFKTHHILKYSHFHWRELTENMLPELSDIQANQNTIEGFTVTDVILVVGQTQQNLQ